MNALAPVVFLVLVIPSFAAEEHVIQLGGNTELTLVRVEAGTFQQGSPEAERDRGTDENQRQVTLTKPFYMGKFPITWAQFSRFVEETRYRTEAETGTSGGFGWDGTKLVQRKDFTWRKPGWDQAGDEPVVLVTWFDAKAFTDWLTRKTGGRFDLPTEAQWEYACRAGSTSTFANGDNSSAADELGWHKGNASSRTHPTGEKPLNAWGIGDLPGNAWEWCLDWYAPYPPGPATDPLQTNQNLSDKPRRVLRGGSWLKDATGLRSAARFRNDARSRNADNGFRVIAWALPSPRPASAVPSTVEPAPLPLERSENERSSSADSVPTTSHGTSSHSIPSAPRPLGLMGGLMSVLCCGGGLFLLIAIVSKIIRGATSGKVAPPIVPNIGGGLPGRSAMLGGALPRTRMGADGFWLEGGDIAADTLLLCRYIAGGTSHSIEVNYQPQPGGQFIYTGARPESVSLSVAGGALPQSLSRYSDDDDDDDRRRRSSFPSAY